MKNFVISLALSIALLSGCSSNKEYPVKVTEINGVKTVSNPDYPKEGEYDLVLDEIYTIGREENNSKYILSKPLFIELDKKENLFVFDYDGPKFFVFDSGGKFLRTFGKKGEGPGDLGGLSFFKVSSDDKLIINDMRNRRICTWNLSGMPLTNSLTKDHISFIELDSKDNLYSCFEEMNTENLTEKTQNVAVTKVFVRRNAENNEWSPIKKFPGEYWKMSRTSNGGMMGGGPYNEFVWKISPDDKLYTGNVDTYEISVSDLNGNPLLKFNREYKRRHNPLYMKRRKQYEFLSPFTRFSTFDSAGNFWANVDTGDSTDTYIYDLFSKEGIYQKQIYSKYKIHAIRGNKIYSLVYNPAEPYYIKAFKYSLKKREK